MNDLNRARALGMSVEEFQSLVGHDPLESHREFIDGAVHKAPSTEKPKKKKKKEVTDAGDYQTDNFPDIGDGTTIPYTTDDDVRNKTARELENYWDRPVTSDEDKALYYGYHIHSKDNVYGLHAHYPGGPLGGGHKHGPQNKLGRHTHRYSPEDLQQYKFARPGFIIAIDGPHEHEYNAPDGKHIHAEENFGPGRDNN